MSRGWAWACSVVKFENLLTATCLPATPGSMGFSAGSSLTPTWSAMTPHALSTDRPQSAVCDLVAALRFGEADPTVDENESRPGGAASDDAITTILTPTADSPTTALTAQAICEAAEALGCRVPHRSVLAARPWWVAGCPICGPHELTLVVRTTDAGGVTVGCAGGFCAPGAALRLMGFEPGLDEFYEYLPPTSRDVCAALEAAGCDSGTIGELEFSVFGGHAECPNCDDGELWLNRDGAHGVMAMCWGGCETENVMATLGLHFVPDYVPSIDYPALLPLSGSEPEPEPAPEPTPEPAPAPLVFGTVAYEAHLLRIRDEAREIIAGEKAGELSLPPLTRLDVLLKQPDEEAAYRVGGILPTGGNGVFVAQNKTGKTTVRDNLARSLVDGDDFLGKFATVPVSRVVIADLELNVRMIRQWMRDQGIVNQQAVEVLPLRGMVSTFNPLNSSNRSRWAERLNGADVFIFDCLRPGLDALGLSEDKDAGRYLEGLTELCDEAKIGELLVVHHIGHGGTRSRGDSRILDWPDAIWTLTKDDADRRYFSAYGRDVDEPESLLDYDPLTRQLTLVGGSRQDAKALGAVGDVIGAVSKSDSGPMSGRAIEMALSGLHTQKAVRAAIKLAVGQGELWTEPGGRGGGMSYRVPDQNAS